MMMTFAEVCGQLGSNMGHYNSKTTNLVERISLMAMMTFIKVKSQQMLNVDDYDDG